MSILVYAALAFGAAGFTFGLAATWHNVEKEGTHRKMAAAEARRILLTLGRTASRVEMAGERYAADCPDGMWCKEDGSMSDEIKSEALDLSHQLARDSRYIMSAANRLVVHAAGSGKPKMLQAAVEVADRIGSILDVYVDNYLPEDRWIIPWKYPAKFGASYGAIVDAVAEITGRPAEK